MKKNKRQTSAPDDFTHLLKRHLKDPEFRKLYQKEGVKLRLGMRIAELRKQAGFSQAELAKRVGVTQGFISQLESADTENYELKTLKKISEAIGMVLVIGFVTKTELKNPSTSMRELVRF